MREGGKGESGPGAAGAPPLLLHRVYNTSSATLAGVGNPGVEDNVGYARAAPVALKVILLRPPLTVPGARAGGRYLRRLLLRQGRVAGPGPAKSRHAGRSAADGLGLGRPGKESAGGGARGGPPP